MPSCPVCEHAQGAFGACEVCGWALPDPAAVPAAEEAPAVEGLERNALVVPAEASALDLPPMDLLPAGADAVSVSAPAPDPAVEPLPDLEPTLAPRDAPTPRAEVLACRYCRTPVPPGAAFCDTCGMRTPRSWRPPEEPGATPESWRCPVCSARAEGARCGACGARAPGSAS